MDEKMSNAIILLGNTGVGKSFICNKIFEHCSSPTKFVSSSSAMSVTQTLQKGEIHYKGKSYSIVDSPGFFDTANNDGINMCKLVKAIEMCDNIYALVFVFTDRFSTPHKIWFERMISLINQSNQGHIVLVHNKQGDYDLNEYTRNSVEIDQSLGGRHEYFWISARPDNSQIISLLDKLVDRNPFTMSNLVIPQVCYEKEEKGKPYEEVIADNTVDEGQHVEEIKDTSHFEDHWVWNRGHGNIFGELGMRGWPGAKRLEKRWVPSQATEQVWVPKMVTRRTIKTYQDIFKVRFDGSKDLHEKLEINSRVEVH